jgi:hypothetical protein
VTRTFFHLPTITSIPSPALPNQVARPEATRSLSLSGPSGTLCCLVELNARLRSTISGIRHTYNENRSHELRLGLFDGAQSPESRHGDRDRKKLVVCLPACLPACLPCLPCLLHPRSAYLPTYLHSTTSQLVPLVARSLASKSSLVLRKKNMTACAGASHPYPVR